jgi:hypothetical protein
MPSDNQEHKNKLNKRFKITDLGPVKQFLGIEILRSNKQIKLVQTVNSKEILD